MTTTHYIGKCPRKGCKATARITADTTVMEHVDNRFGGYDVRQPAFTVGLLQSRNAHIQRLGQLLNHGLAPHCVEHRVQLRFVKPVQGTVNEAVRCDARCEGARGHVCDCSCGGANHGRAHG